MRSRPDLSVVVACHDAQRTLGRTLSSLLASAGPQLEIVAVDDGSTDGTFGVLSAAAEADDRITVVRHLQNRGLPAARNTAMRTARGRWIGFVDADDQVTPDHFAHLVAAGDRLEVDVVRADHVRTGPGVRELRQCPESRRGIALDPRLAAAPTDHRTIADEPHACFGLVRDTLVADGVYDFPEDLRAAEDRVPWWRLLLAARSLAVVSSPGYRYWRGDAGSLSQSSGEYQLDLLAAQRRVIDLVAASSYADLLLPKAVRQTVGLLTVHGTREDRFGDDGAVFFAEGARRLLLDIECDHPMVWLAVLSELPPSRQAYVEELLTEEVPA